MGLIDFLVVEWLINNILNVIKSLKPIMGEKDENYER